MTLRKRAHGFFQHGIRQYNARSPHPSWIAVSICLPALLLAVALAGCSSAAVRPAVQDAEAAWVARQYVLAPISAWEIKGRLSLRAADDGWHANLRWVRDREHHEIDLSGPVGQGHIKLSQDASGARLRDSNHKTHYARNAQELLRAFTGWQVPLEGLNFWILGIPVPDIPLQRALDGQGRLETLSQLGWDVRFLKYTHEGNNDLPGKLFIKRRLDEPGSAAKTLEVRLVIDRWMLSPTITRE